ncbi:MAG: DUF4252 domain-containing protein [Bacteroidaceae bacterium]|nr:DUF4252 domain-containing protein [Bacteroidaceae bacterium]
MKKLIIMTLLVLMGNTANAQKKVFQKYQDKEGVTTLHVPKFLMRIAGRADNEAKKLTDKIKGIRVMTCENSDMAKKIKQEALAAYRSEGYEEILRVKEDGEQILIYQLTMKNGKSKFALLAEDEELAIINITGHLSLDDVRAIEDMLD